MSDKPIADDGRTHWAECWREHLDCAAAEVAAVRERYCWLADKVIAPDYGDNESVPHQKGYLIERCKGPEVIYGPSLDAAIDAALAEKGEP